MLIDKDELLEGFRNIESKCEVMTSARAMDAVRQLINSMTPAYDMEMVITLIQTLKHPYGDFPDSFSQQQVINFYLEKAVQIIVTGGMDEKFNAGYASRIEAMQEYRGNCRRAFEKWQKTQMR